MTFQQDEIKRMGESKQIPTRVVVLDLEGKVIGCKIDSCWSLSGNLKEYKVHSFQNTALEKHLTSNLLSGFNEYNRKDTSPQGTWFEKYPNGVIISVQGVSESNFGKELLRYRVLKEKDKYIAEEIK